jgi:flagellar assembly protein FliH
MTSSDIGAADAALGGDRNSDVRRWVLPSLVDWEPVAGSSSEPEIQPPTAEEIAAMQTAAYDEAFARGHSEGREAGRKQGYDEGRREARQQASQLTAALDHLAAPLADIDPVVERSLLELSLSIAEKLVARQLALAPDTIQAVVSEALEAAAGDGSAMRVHLHPDDAALMNELEPATEARRWTLVPDAAMARGGCRVITDIGQVDARHDTRHAEIERALSGAQG